MKMWFAATASLAVLLALSGCKGGASPAPQPASEAAKVPAAPVAAAPAQPAVQPAAPTPQAQPAPVVEYKPVDLPEVKAPAAAFPPFDGQKLALVHTENVVGELEPCG